tara:strand:+ start:14557 stop:14817 length:261 start_codon:yes stop_codon:yes gene_type:complete
MSRVYLITIISSILVALIFSGQDFMFEPKSSEIFGKEIIVTSQIILSGLTSAIILTFLGLTFIEKGILLFKSKKKESKKKEMAVKK